MGDVVDRLGRSELHYAAADGNPDKVKELLAKGFNQDLPDHGGWTPLHFAAQANSQGSAKLLIDVGADVNAADTNGNTPLFRAVFSFAGEEFLTCLLVAVQIHNA